jgi:hypothetical protein
MPPSINNIYYILKQFTKKVNNIFVKKISKNAAERIDSAAKN